MRSIARQPLRYRLIAAIAVVAALGFAAYAVLGSGDSVAPLVKAEGWREDLLMPSRSTFAHAEIAFDRETAERAWVENTPGGLPRRSGTPEEPGIYGDLGDVDFQTHAIVVWSSGQSSACPGWLADMSVDGEGAVSMRVEDSAGWFGACTDDYNAYRMIVAVERSRLPEPSALPTENVTGIPSGVVLAYPAEQ